MPHSAQPQHTNYWALRTRKRHQQEHRPQRPTGSSNPTQHAKGKTGDCPGPRKGATTRRNVTQGVGQIHPATYPPKQYILDGVAEFLVYSLLLSPLSPSALDDEREELDHCEELLSSLEESSDRFLFFLVSFSSLKHPSCQPENYRCMHRESICRIKRGGVRHCCTFRHSGHRTQVRHPWLTVARTAKKKEVVAYHHPIPDPGKAGRAHAAEDSQALAAQPTCFAHDSHINPACTVSSRPGMCSVFGLQDRREELFWKFWVGGCPNPPPPLPWGMGRFFAIAFVTRCIAFALLYASTTGNRFWGMMLFITAHIWQPVCKAQRLPMDGGTNHVE